MKTTKDEWLKRFRQQGKIWWLYLNETNGEEGMNIEWDEMVIELDLEGEELTIDTDEGNDVSFEAMKIEDEVIWIEYTDNGYVMDLPAMYVSSDSLKKIYEYMEKYLLKLKEYGE